MFTFILTLTRTRTLTLTTTTTTTTTTTITTTTTTTITTITTITITLVSQKFTVCWPYTAAQTIGNTFCDPILVATLVTYSEVLKDMRA